MGLSLYHANVREIAREDRARRRLDKLRRAAEVVQACRRTGDTSPGAFIATWRAFHPDLGLSDGELRVLFRDVRP